MEHFQRWVASQNFDEQVKETFAESLRCYKADAYKASLLFGYLGMLHVVKFRILTANPPSGFDEISWAKKQKPATDDTTWDQTVFGYLKQTKEDQRIFFISDDIKHQLEYWKGRRNDCAHGKDNIIRAEHVVAFYAFIESNLPKFVVNGSMESLINEIKDHFDVEKTRPNEPVGSLVSQVNDAVSDNELEKFFNEVILFLYKEVAVANNFAFINQCLNNTTKRVEQACATALLKNKTIFIAFLRAYPADSRILDKDRDSKLIRGIWYKELWANMPYRSIYNNDILIIVNFFSLKLIDKKDHNTLFKILLDQAYFDRVDDSNNHIFKEIGFYKYIYNEIVNESLMQDFNLGEKAQRAIIFYLKYNTIDELIAEKLTENFNGDFYTFALVPVLNAFFRNNPHKVEEFHNHVDGTTIFPPQHLPSLQLPE